MIERQRTLGVGLIAAFEQFLKSQGYAKGTEFRVADWLESYTKMELNTAFASVPLALMKKHGIPADIINVAGGATTPIGHPLGASGARIATTLIHNMIDRESKLGLATMCIGIGQGIATIFERVE